MTDAHGHADATVPAHASIDTIRFLQARIRELRYENEQLKHVAHAAEMVATSLDQYKQLSPVLTDQLLHLWWELHALDADA